MKTRVALVVVGAVLTAYAIGGVLAGQIGVAVFLLAVLVGHDLVWMPALLAAGWLIGAAIRKKFARPRVPRGR